MGENYDLCYNGDAGYINSNCILVMMMMMMIIIIIIMVMYGAHE